MAKKVVKIIETKKSNYKPLYKLNLPIKEKIEIICKEIYGAEKIEFSNKALKMIKKAESLGFGNFPICISKTQKSISDNPSLLGAPKNYTLNIDEIKQKVSNSSELIENAKQEKLEKQEKQTELENVRA